MPRSADLSSLPAYVASLAGLGPLPAVIEHRANRSTTVTYADVIGRAAAWAADFEARRLPPGARVLIWGRAGAAWAIAYYGCILAGAVAVPLDPGLSEAFALRVCRHTEAALVCIEAGAERPLDATTASSNWNGVPALSFDAIARLAPRPLAALPAPAPDALFQIVYTSGATGDPKGVMITHGNLLANLRPVAHEIARYKPRARWLLPLRLVHLIPLSHLFGQVMGLLIPPLLDSAVVYPDSLQPAQWAAVIRQHRASVLVCVPRQLDLFQQWVCGATPAPAAVIASAQGHGVPWRWWHWRRLHRRLGWRMWAFVTGGAALAPEHERVFQALGFAVLQGYGLTETAPAIAITHPFKPRSGAVGRKLAGVDLRLAEDGEILVRGANVSPGYYRDPAATSETFADGWLHTGDLGRLDAEGNLHFLGRKKEVIVTADGLNVYPADVERALTAQPEIADCAVVEQRRPAADPGGAGQVHAVLVPRPGAAPAEIEAAVARANQHLEAHQRVRAFSLWPQPQLPRTSSTQKLQRAAIAHWLAAGAEPIPGEAAWKCPQPSGHPLPAIEATTPSDQRERPESGVEYPPASQPGWRDFLRARWGIIPERLRSEAQLDADLGLTSLDRVELLGWLEAHAEVPVDEAALTAARTVADLECLLALPGSATPGEGGSPAAPPPPPHSMDRFYRDWPLRPLTRRFRALAQPALVLPALRIAVRRLDVEGVALLPQTRQPVLFVANHQSMLDVPVILRALPSAWRPWLAPAMGADLVASLFLSGSRPRRREWWRYQLLRAFFGVFLLSERGAVGGAFHFAGELVSRGYSPLVFPEGARTRDGRLLPFRPGAAVLAKQLAIPIVPVRLDGLFEILPIGATRLHPGNARVRFGPPLDPAATPSDEVTGTLRAWFAKLSS